MLMRAAPFMAALLRDEDERQTGCQEVGRGIALAGKVSNPMLPRSLVRRVEVPLRRVHTDGRRQPARFVRAGQRFQIFVPALVGEGQLDQGAGIVCRLAPQ